jgi:hypothetical protein
MFGLLESNAVVLKLGVATYLCVTDILQYVAKILKS